MRVYKPTRTSSTPIEKRAKKSHGLQTVVNSVRSLLPEVVKFQTGEDITHLATKYYYFVDLWIKAEGKRSATLRLKNVYLLALRSMTNDPVELPFIKTNRRGFPKRFDFLETFWISRERSPQAMQAVLSILGYYRNILAPGIPDLSSITEPGPEIPETILDEIIDLGWNPDWFIKPKKLNPVKIELRSKRGPNGQATVSAFADLASLTPEMLSSIKTILSKSDDEDNLKFTVSSLSSKVSKSPLFHHSRLAVKRELGGKDRVFAMVDYWTQITLKPLHDGLGNILRTLSQDCTYDQMKGKADIESWTREGSAISVDLSSASDRFPVSLQVKILEKLTGDKDFSQSWKSLMVDRDFKYKSKTYRWAVGQPLGAHSSWPSFALAHHIVMRAAYKKCNIDPKGQYYLLGDDMAAKNSEAIVHYLDYLNSLGVEISPTKGLKGNSCEFAKRVFWKGHEVSPVPVPMLQALVSDKCLLPEFVASVRDRSSENLSDLRTSSLLDTFALRLKWNREVLSILAEYPLPQMRHVLSQPDPPLAGVNPNVQWNGRTYSYDQVLEVYNQIRFSHLIRQLDELTRKARVKQASLNEVELPATSTGIRRMHPLYFAYGNYFDEVEAAKKDVRGYLASSDRWSVVPMVNLTNVTSLLKGSRKGAKHSAKLLFQLYRELESLPEQNLS